MAGNVCINTNQNTELAHARGGFAYDMWSWMCLVEWVNVYGDQTTQALYAWLGMNVQLVQLFLLPLFEALISVSYWEKMIFRKLLKKEAVLFIKGLAYHD